MSSTELMPQPHNHFLYTVLEAILVELHDERLAMYTAKSLLKRAAHMKIQTVRIKAVLVTHTGT